MSNKRIDIDQEVYEALLNNVQDFQETPNSVLRRLLKVGGAAPKAAAPAAPKKRGRKPGRPAKKTTAAAAPKKRGRKPGRPAKKATASAAPKKSGRKPGRPPKAKSAAAPKAAAKKTAAPKAKKSAGKRGRKPSKSVKNVSAPRASSSYHKLYESLKSEKGNSVEYTFGQVEKIIGSKLPDSAAKYPAWWSNNTTGHRKSWLAAGYMVDGIDLDSKKVTFKR